MAIIKKCLACTMLLAGLYSLNPPSLSADSDFSWYLYCLLPVVAFESICMCHPSEGGWTPVQISLTENSQIFDKSDSVYGLRIDIIHGCNDTVAGVDAGLFTTAENLYGLQAALICNSVNDDACALQFGGFVNMVDKMYGVQLAGFVNMVDTMYGVQIAGIFNMSEDFTGIQVSGISSNNRDEFSGLQLSTLFNYCDEIKGMQFSLVNYSDETYGIQAGLVNIGENVCGVQIGLVNYTKRMSGVQIGLVNIIENGALPLMVFFNAGMSLNTD